jgi:hypothetical protein
VAFAQQSFANVRADEARAAGDEKIHATMLTTPAPTVERDQERKLIFSRQKNLISSSAFLVFHLPTILK